MYPPSPRQIVPVLLVGALVSGCAVPQAPTQPQAADEQPSPPATQLDVPEAYDTSRGWEDDAEHYIDLNDEEEPLVLPRAGAIASFRDGEFTVRDIPTGETRWSSAPVEPVGEKNEIRALALFDSEADYLVAYSSGTPSEDALARNAEVTAVDVFAGDGSGSGVEHLYRVEAPGAGDVTVDGAHLLVTTGEGAVTIDPATGDAIDPDRECSEDCDPLPGGLQGVWTVDDAGRELDIVDRSTGEVLATAGCPPEDPTRFPSGTTRLSGNARYLVHGITAFDLDEGVGHCFESTDETHYVALNTVNDLGQAYGSSEDNTINVDVTSGVATSMPSASFPFADVGGYGLFWEKDRHLKKTTLVVYPHA